jgi:hypothetical protein
MISNVKPIASLALALGLALTSLPATGLAAPALDRHSARAGATTSAPSQQSDLAVALIDAWARMGDTLSAYQDATANEAFLHTSGLHGSRRISRIQSHSLPCHPPCTGHR